MVSPPENLVLEISAQGGDLCPVRCRHCIHRNVGHSAYPKLSPTQILDVIEQGKDLGVKCLNIYPHQGDVALGEQDEITEYLRLARNLGLQVKSITSGINPRGVERLLPLLDRLAISVDALDPQTYGVFRSPANFTGLLETLTLLHAYKRIRPDLCLTALVMVSKQTLDSIERRVAEIIELGIFSKIKLLEVLPIGGASAMRAQALLEKSFLLRLADVQRRYQKEGLRIGVPLWRVKNHSRGCRLGSKDLVVGPHGELAGCSLLLYLNQFTGNLHEVPLSEAWRHNFQRFREKASREVALLCKACPFYQEDLCWGGCLARGDIFGREAEISRSCGVRSVKEAGLLYDRFCQWSRQCSEGVFSAISGLTYQGEPFRVPSRFVWSPPFKGSSAAAAAPGSGKTA